MPFDARTRDAIRDAFLADLLARYAAAGQTLDISTLSHHHRTGSALALVLSLYDAMGVGLDDEILPDKATYSVERHAKVEGITRDPAVAAIEQVTVTGTPSAVLALSGKTVTATDGLTYAVSANADGTGTSVTLSGGGTATAYATCQTAGAAGTKPVGTILTWSSAPTGANPTVTVAAVTRAGVDQETLTALAARVIARRQERPASGNRADWQDWANAVAGVDDAVVYPLLHSSLGVNTPGAMTVIPLGQAQGDSATNSRIVSGTVVTNVAGYIEGTKDANGNTVTNGTQLRPVTMAAGDYAIEAALTQTQNVEATLVLAAAYAPPFTTTADVVLASPVPTTTTFSITGNVAATFAPSGVPLPILVNVGTGNYRGGFYKVTPSSVTWDSGNGRTNFVVPTLPGAPVSASRVLPGLSNFGAIRTALFALFDDLGPGDTSPASRWPGQETRLRATLYTAQLIGAFTDVDGVLSATLVAPAANVAPAAKTIVTLGTLTVYV